MFPPAGQKDLVVLAQVNQLAAGQRNGNVESLAADVFRQVKYTSPTGSFEPPQIFARAIGTRVINNQQLVIVADSRQVAFDTLAQQLDPIPVENDRAEHHHPGSINAVIGTNFSLKSAPRCGRCAHTRQRWAPRARRGWQRQETSESGRCETALASGGTPKLWGCVGSYSGLPSETGLSTDRQWPCANPWRDSRAALQTTLH